MGTFFGVQPARPGRTVASRWKRCDEVLQEPCPFVEILAAHKLRTLLSVLGIVVGVAAVILMVSAGKGAEKRILDRIRQMGTNLITVSAGQTKIIAGRQRQMSTVTTLEAKMPPRSRPSARPLPWQRRLSTRSWPLGGNRKTPTRPSSGSPRKDLRSETSPSLPAVSSIRTNAAAVAESPSSGPPWSKTSSWEPIR